VCPAAPPSNSAQFVLFVSCFIHFRAHARALIVYRRHRSGHVLFRLVANSNALVVDASLEATRPKRTAAHTLHWLFFFLNNNESTYENLVESNRTRFVVVELFVEKTKKRFTREQLSFLSRINAESSVDRASRSSRHVRMLSQKRNTHRTRGRNRTERTRTNRSSNRLPNRHDSKTSLKVHIQSKGRRNNVTLSTTKDVPRAHTHCAGVARAIHEACARTTASHYVRRGRTTARDATPRPTADKRNE
jgi:hypothetical protein